MARTWYYGVLTDSPFLMQVPRLIFHPNIPDVIADPDALQAALSEIGFIGEPRDEDRQHSFYVGEHFLELLTFLGCSPVIALGPEEGERYCYIETATFQQPRFIAGSQPFQPRCRHCRQAIPDWQQQLDGLEDMAHAKLQCGHCQRLMPLSEVNWKHSAGIARQMISVYNIYLHEAVPGEKILATLAQTTPACEWRYFYAI